MISNRDGQVVHDGREVLDRIVSQVGAPVRWDLCMETMLDLGVTGILEMPPAGTLTGIAKRAMKGVETFALKTPDQLDDARAFVDKHGAPSQLDGSPTWRMLVSPSKGTFRQTPDLRRGRPAARRRPRSARSPGCATRHPITRAARRHHRRVARPRRRPGLPRPAAGPPAPGRVSPHDRTRHRPPARRTPRSSASAPTARAAWCPTPRSSTRSTPPTSGSSSARASRAAASPPTTRPCR